METPEEASSRQTLVPILQQNPTGLGSGLDQRMVSGQTGLDTRVEEFDLLGNPVCRIQDNGVIASAPGDFMVVKNLDFAKNGVGGVTIVGESPMVDGKVVVKNTVKEMEIPPERNDCIGVAVVSSIDSRIVESEVLVERNGGKGSGQGNALVSSISDASTVPSFMDGGAKEDSNSQMVNGVLGLGVLDVKGNSNLGNEVGCVGLSLEKDGKLGFSESLIPFGDGGQVTKMRVSCSSEVTELERFEKIAVHATGANIDLPVANQKMVSEHDVGKLVHLENQSLEKGVLGHDSQTGVQGSEVSMNDAEKRKVVAEDKETSVQANQYLVGDLVWARIKNNRWWPGRICNPSDASNLADKHGQRGSLPVAYFGIGTFAWCYLFQVKPFLKDFEQMLNQSNSISFHSAVEQALNELVRYVKLEMSCPCVLPETETASRGVVSVHARINEGVTFPKRCIGGLPNIEFEPSSFLAHVKDVARVVSISDMLEIIVLRGQLSAFWWANGRGRVPYHELWELSPEGNAENHKLVKIELDDQSTIDPAELDWISSPIGPSVSKHRSRKVRRISKDKSHQRKKRSMAELMAGNLDTELQNDSDGLTEEEKVSDELIFPSKKQKKNVHVTSPSLILENKDDIGNDAAEGNSTSSSKKRRKTDNFTSHAPAENNSSAIKIDDVGNDGTALSSPRIRRKSKYLSPPYTMLSWSNALFTFNDVGLETPKTRRTSQVEESISRKDVKTETPMATLDSQAGDSVSGIMGELTGSPQILEFSSEALQEKVDKTAHEGHKTASGSTPLTPKVKKKNTSVLEDDTSADKMLLEFLSTALNPLYLRGNSSSKAVRRFFSKYRSSLYLRGSDFDTYRKYMADLGASERMFPWADHVSMETDPKEADHTEGNSEHLPTKPSSLGKGSNEAHQSKSKFGSGGRKRKYLSNDHISLAKESGKAHKSGSKSGLKKREGKQVIPSEGKSGQMTIEGKDVGSLPSPNGRLEQFTLGKDSRNADMSEGKSGSKTGDGMSEGKSGSKTGDGMSEGNSGSKTGDGKHVLQSEGNTGQKKKEGKAEMSLLSPSNGLEQSILGKDSSNADKSECNSVLKPSEGKQVLQSEVKPGRKKREKKVKMGSHFRSPGSSGHSAIPMELNVDSPAALLLRFAPGMPLPTKDDLIPIFSKFGVLSESEIEVSRDSGCARVVYAKKSDAELAFYNMNKNNIVGPAIIGYQLQYLSAPSRGWSGLQIPPMERCGFVTPPPLKAGTGPPLHFIQQNLEVMMSMLSESAGRENSPEKLSPEVRSNLAGEIKGLLKKVNTLMGPSS